MSSEYGERLFPYIYIHAIGWFRKGRGPEIKWPTSIRSQREQGNSRKTSTSASLAMLKPLTMWITTNCEEFLKKW